MPTPAYLTIKGTSQGLITAGALSRESVGNAWQKGRENQILVQAVGHGISVPGGVQSGRRMHKPFVITKVMDKSTPLLYNAVRDGEALTLCRLDWYRPSHSGGLEHFFTTELTGAVIVDVELVMPHCQNESTAHYTQLESVHIAYQNITWRHEIGGTSGWDMWQGER